jgi:hypothetical protein
MGTNGFFGPYYVDNSTLAGGPILHSVNAWLGSQAANDQMVSGTNGSANYMYMNTNVDIRINPALRVRGTYYIGSWTTPDAGALGSTGNLAASYYYNYTAPGVQRSFSPGYWNTLWLTAQLPWGTVAIGKRPSIFGTGLAWNGTENRSSESFAINAPYGPMNLIISFYPSREGNESYYNRNFDQSTKRM